MLVISGEDVERVAASIDYEELVQLMRTVFETLSTSPSTLDPEGPQGEDVASPLRTVIQSQKQTTLFMPSRLAVAGGSGIKVVSVPRQGASTDGLPATTLLLNDDTGGVNAVVNATQLTALRNAAGPSSSLCAVLYPSLAQLFLMQVPLWRHAWPAFRAPPTWSYLALGCRYSTMPEYSCTCTQLSNLARL